MVKQAGLWQILQTITVNMRGVAAVACNFSHTSQVYGKIILITNILACSRTTSNAYLGGTYLYTYICVYSSVVQYLVMFDYDFLQFLGRHQTNVCDSDTERQTRTYHTQCLYGFKALGNTN